MTRMLHLLIGLLAIVETASAQGLADVDRKWETYLMTRLEQVQRDQPDARVPFATDGCSGGMSEGWMYLAAAFPAFQEKFGRVPPWQACCVAHDREYWAGDTDGGHDKRLAADVELKQCVVRTGQDQSDVLSREWEVAAKDVEQAFAVAAELMYAAVRVGGKPCSLFPWRWGYGWPLCPLLPSAE